jgi:hypothetical protein
VLFHTRYSQYFDENVHVFDALDFLAEAYLMKPYPASSRGSLCGLHSTIPPKGMQVMRRYGLYSSRIKGRWEERDYVADRAPQGWRTGHELSAACDEKPLEFCQPSDSEEVESTARKSACARWVAGMS